MFRSIVLSACISSCLAVTCYDCYNTGPNHENCTRERKCSGLACVISTQNRNHSCWLDPDGRGRHCICYSDFCNDLIGTAIEFFLRYLIRVHYKNCEDASKFPICPSRCHVFFPEFS
ncbi:unnamed protein product [Angiostrongylus costaricensis]|uniref:Phospholipase A(2) n=1 Tax=Angiostrongylus costaricensis TaxID=334426 RepID=A0A0R3PLA9_ANGCS|nr:unnamed protein product [Angiostrongylus costaricensis]